MGDEAPEMEVQVMKRYDNTFKSSWTDKFPFIKASRKGNMYAFCEYCQADLTFQ